MNIVVQYFWFICAIVWALNIFIGKRRLRPMIKSGQMTVDDVNDFQRRAITAIAIPSVLLGTIQLIGGYRDPMFIYSTPLDNPYTLISWLISLAANCLFLYWLWFKQGAESLSRFGPLFRLSGKPAHFRVGFTLAIPFVITMAILFRNQ